MWLLIERQLGLAFLPFVTPHLIVNGFMIDWLDSWAINWLLDWLIARLLDCSIAPLINWLIDWLLPATTTGRVGPLIPTLGWTMDCF
jgi:hypothetical protein